MSAASSACAAPPRVVSAAPHSDIPHYTIDLDLPPSQRWTQLIARYKPYWATMVKEMWREFAELHGDHFDTDDDSSAAVAPKSKRAKKVKLTAAQIAAAEAARHAKHVEFATQLASQMLDAFRTHGLGAYAEELEAVSAGSGISIAELVLLNLSYEAHGGCTTILTPTQCGSVMMGRTLDWQQPALKHLTVELSFMRGGRLVYRATSFAGFLGIFTGHKPNAYAVAVNFRSTDDSANGEDDDDDDDAEEEDEGEEEDVTPDSDSSPAFSWPVGFLVRHTLESVDDYDSAIDRLHRCALMSQVYFIVCGTTAQQACIITRDPEASIKPIRLAHAHAQNGTDMDLSDSPAPAASTSKKARGIGRKTNGDSSHAAALAFNTAPIAAAPADSIPPADHSPHPWLVQANMDYWLTARRLDHQSSLPRTKLVHQVLKRHVDGGDAIDESRMWRLMALDPIWDEETIYATVSIPSQDRFVTLIENPHPAPPTKGKKGATQRRRRN